MLGRFLVVAPFAKALQVGLIPEQVLVPFVGDDVINGRGPNDAAFTVAAHAKRMLGEMGNGPFMPYVVVPSLRGSPPLRLAWCGSLRGCSVTKGTGRHAISLHDRRNLSRNVEQLGLPIT